MSVVDEIKQRLDIVEVIGGYVPLQKAGRNFKGLCPFHTEKTPSFIVFPESQNWHCFGACSTGGDLFSFIMRIENLDFPEALRLLADKAGIELRPLDQEEIRVQDELDRLREVNAAAAQEFHRVLIDSSEGEGVRRYLEGRGVTRQTMSTFQLGYAPDEWHRMEGRLRAAGFAAEDILAAGLTTRSDKGNVYDRFRGRLMFPIRDAQGVVVGFAGRVLDDSLPKYLNTPQTPLFDKGSVLYGIDLARQAIRETGTAIIVEGYMDVIVPYQCGVRNLVAVMGTALSKAHMEVLRRITRVLVLALDPDAAGMRATERGIEVAQESLEHHVVPVPTATGLIRYEKQLDAEVRVLALPEGLDPDELILQDRAEWDRLVEGALPVADYFYELVLADTDLTSAKSKRDAVERLLPVIAAMDSSVERTHHIQRLAQQVRVDDRALALEVERLRVRGGRARAGASRDRRRRAEPPAMQETLKPGLTLEQRCLALVVTRPALLPDIVDTVGLCAEAFGDVRARQAFELLRDQEPAELAGTDALPQAFARLDIESRAHVESVLQGFRAGPPLTPDMVREDLIKCSTRLQKTYLSRLIRELRFLLQDAQEEGATELVRELNTQIEQCTRNYQALDRLAHAATFVGRKQLR